MTEKMRFENAPSSVYRKDEWVNVSNQLPENKETVIVCDKDGKVMPAFYNDENKLWLVWTGWKHLELNPYFKPIYWSPLPKPPIILLEPTK